MRKYCISFFVSAALLITVLRAQIVLTSSDFASAGDSVIWATDTIPTGIAVGDTGYQVWDFTSLNKQIVDTFYFDVPSSFPSGSSFPSSNLAGDIGSEIDFFIHTAGQTELDGFFSDPLGGGTPIPQNLRDNLLLMAYPSTLGSQYSDTAYYDTTMSTSAFPQLSPYADSVYYRIILSMQSIIDGHGIVLTPSGTDSVIRRFAIRVSYMDSVMAKGGFFPVWTDVLPLLGLQPETLYVYSFFANGKKWPVAELETDSPGGNAISGSYQMGTIVGAEDFAARDSRNIIFPNPVHGIFKLDFNNAVDNLTIFNRMGQVIFQATESSLTIQVDITDQSPGLYFLQFQSGNSIKTEKFVLF
ncbi:MAG: T9SS type A sorting domain-containing protein [Bacteroidetes bacterium]|nr:T9SS type A sorting domain-containing protein [Bacteroidota bacterium]